MKPCEWLIYKKTDGRSGCIPATNAVKAMFRRNRIKTMLCTEAEAIAECVRIDKLKEKAG